MGRITKTARVGEVKKQVSVVAGTSTAATLPSHGHSVLSTADGEVVMAAPAEGAVKRISVLGITTTTANVTVRGSTATDVTFTAAGATQLVFNATVDMHVDLLGVSSTRWVITGAYPPGAAVNSTGIVAGTS